MPFGVSVVDGANGRVWQIEVDGPGLRVQVLAEVGGLLYETGVSKVAAEGLSAAFARVAAEVEVEPAPEK